MKIWAIANQKGGVGKTTTTVALAGALASAGHKTLMIDFDPHGSLTAYFGRDPDEISFGAYQLFQRASNGDSDGIDQLIIDSGFDNLYFLPASTALATLDRQLGAHRGMGLVLNKALASVQDTFDYALIDCPPLLGILMINAMASCEEVLIPVQTEFLALKGLERMLKTLTMLEKSRSTPLPYTIIPTFFDRRTRASLDSLRKMRSEYAPQVWQGVIPVDTQFREASRMGQPPSSACAHSRGYLAYVTLLKELVSSSGIT